MNSVLDSENSTESTGSDEAVDKNMIDKILGEMKSQFNKTDKPPKEPNLTSEEPLQQETVETSEETQAKAEEDSGSSSVVTPAADIAAENESGLKPETEVELSIVEETNKTEEESTSTKNTSELLPIDAEPDSKVQEDVVQPQSDKDCGTAKKKSSKIILLFKKPAIEPPTTVKQTKLQLDAAGRRSTRNKSLLASDVPNNPVQSDDSKASKEPGVTLKRSARRRSKDCTESILQSAIARKEKSYNESSKPQRLTRQLKPTQKILENLELAKQERGYFKSEKGSRSSKTNNFQNSTKSPDKSSKSNDSDNNCIEQEQDPKFDEQFNEKSYRKHNKHKHHNHNNGKHAKKHAKRQKTSNFYADSVSKESNSDQSMEEDSNGTGGDKDQNEEETAFRRSRRISSSKCRDDFDMDVDERGFPENPSEIPEHTRTNTKCSAVGAELIASRLCLCTHKTQYYLAPNDEEITYCGAYDHINDKTIGCTRVIDTKEMMMLRSSARIPYTVLCDAHRNRMLRHNCCPTCGIFCTQGRFAECDNKHQYHRQCQIAVGGMECCPHCGLSTPGYDVNITMHTTRKPVFLPTQKNPQYASARMTFQNNNSVVNNNNRKADDVDFKPPTPPLIPMETIELLSSSEYNQDRDALYDLNSLIEAIKSDAVEKVAAILMSKSFDFNAILSDLHDGTLLHLAAQHGSSAATVHMLLLAGLQTDAFDKEQNTPLMLAVLAEKNDVVRYLIKAGASIDIKGTDGMTALHVAAKSGNLIACELLLDAALALVHLKRTYVDTPDDGGWTPLVWACENGYARVARFLLSMGADPSIRDVEHNVALHWAAFSGRSRIVEMLLNVSDGKKKDGGCDVNAVNAHGDTPLHIAARQDMYNSVLVLLARGANVTLLNKNNESPIDCVPENGDSYHAISFNITMQASIDFNCPNVILTNDISKGKETNPIQCVNSVDGDATPANFVYITKSRVNSNDVRIDTRMSSVKSCGCTDRCTVDEDCCSCGKMSVKSWYDERGRLVSDFDFADIPMIFECNDGCSCNVITCNNRVVQKGLAQRFELFKTPNKGWAIRTLRAIPRGSFVCEYVGEIITDLEAEKREDDSFLFDLENRVCNTVSEADSYCIDAKFFGNFARFINHSCNANLTPVKVFVEHQDLRFPRIAFFANRDIMTEEELSFDYGEKFWMAKYKSLSCNCGSENCRYSEETIESSVQDYQRKLSEGSD